ncbi:hypothetical protein BGW41_005833 [Actinomortierella wolfii]|nr:hypothetical protein BGW41_005833 [Actinomortierella wolfii]
MLILTQLALSVALPLPEASSGTTTDGSTSDDSINPAGFGSNAGITSPINTDVGQKTRTTSGHIVLGILLMLAGLLQVFYGFKFIRLTLLVGGFVTWALVASIVMVAIRWDLLFETFNPKMYYFWVWFLTGLIGATLSFRFFDLGIAMAGALGGFAVAMVIIAAANARLSEVVRYVIIGIFVLFFSGIATFYERFFIIAGTSLGGAMIFMFGVDEFVQVGFREMLVIFRFVGKTLAYNPTYKVYIMLGGVVVLALMGTAWEHWHHQAPLLVDRRALFRLYGRPFGKRPKRMIGQKIKHRYREVGWKGLFGNFLKKRSADSVLYGSEPDESWLYVDENGDPVPADQQHHQQQQGQQHEQQQQQHSAAHTTIDPSSSASYLGEDDHPPAKEAADSTGSSGIDTKVDVDDLPETQTPEGKAEWEPAPVQHSTSISSDSGNVQVIEVYETFPVSVIEEVTTVVSDGGVQQQVEELDVQHRPPLTVIQNQHQMSETHTMSSESQSTSLETHASSSQAYTSTTTHTSMSSSNASSSQSHTYSSSSTMHTSSQTQTSSSTIMHASSQSHMSSSDMHSSSSTTYAGTQTLSSTSTKITKTTTTRATTTASSSSSHGVAEVSTTIRGVSQAIQDGQVITTTTTTSQTMNSSMNARAEKDEVGRPSPDSDHP